MHVKRKKEYFFYIFFYLLAIFILETFFQITQRHLLLGDEFFYSFFKWADNDSILSKGLQRPLILNQL